MSRAPSYTPGWDGYLVAVLVSVGLTILALAVSILPEGLGQGAATGEDLGAALAMGDLDPAVELLDELVLAGEPVVGVARGHAGLGRDRAHRRPGVPPLLEELDRGVEDVLAGVSPHGRNP